MAKKLNTPETRIGKESKLGKTIDKFFKRLYRKYPVVIVITGEVGTGKSRSILLNLLGYWYTHNHNMCPPKEFLTADVVRYSAGLRSATPMNLVALDEAIDAFGKGASDRKIVNAFTQMFGICRERQVATVVVIDDIFLITTKLAKYINLWIHTEKRIDNLCKDCNEKFAGQNECPHCGSYNVDYGCVAYRAYSKSRLRDVLRENENRTVKSINVKGVYPNFRSAIREYKGSLVDYYSQMKTKKTEETMDELIKTVKISKRKLKEAEKEFLNRKSDEKMEA